DETLAFVSEEKRSIVRHPIAKLWNSGARIHADGMFGTRETCFKFNQYGFQSFCNLVDVSDRTLHRLHEPELASRVLNDLFSEAMKRQGRALGSQLVVDQKAGTVIGVVSEKYVGYSNDTFLRDVMSCLDERNNGALFPNMGEFSFKQSYSITSRLFLRLSSTSVKGVVSGRGGRGEDISEIGVEVSNSMA